MKRMSLCVLMLAPMIFAGRGDFAEPEPVYARIDISALNPAELDGLKQTNGIAWWVEAADELVVLTDERALPALERAWQAQALDIPVASDRLVIAGAAHGHDSDGYVGSVITSAGRLALIQLEEGRDPEDLFTQEALDTDDPNHRDHGCGTMWRPFEGNQVLASLNRATASTKLKRAEIQTMVDAVNQNRWFCDVQELAGYSRVTGSDDLAEAGDWLFGQFERLPNMQVTRQEFTARGSTVFNVVATLPGTVKPDDIYIVGGHYDSIASRDGGAVAPGAEDNGSGAAGVLEMARIFSSWRPHATMVFICFSAEEQGLFGSQYHVQQLMAGADSDKLIAVLNMDMIGYSGDDDLDVLLEGHPTSQFMIDAFSNAASDYTNLRTESSLNPFGSDHVPYINNGYPALLTIQNDWDIYPGYHRSTDLPENIVLDMGGEILRMNVAAMAEMAGVDSAKDRPPIMQVWAY